MNILPKKRNALIDVQYEEDTSTKSDEEQGELVSGIRAERYSLPDIEVNAEDLPNDEDEEEYEIPPDHKEDSVFETKESNYIEPQKPTPKKKKRKLSEKQSAHLARMRIKSAAIRKKRTAGKKEATRLKKLEAARRKKEREKKKLEVSARRVIRQKKEDKLVEEANTLRNNLKKDGYNMAFEEFFGHMARYDKIKRVRKRARKEKAKPKPKLITKPQKPTNPYTNWF